MKRKIRIIFVLLIISGLAIAASFILNKYIFADLNDTGQESEAEGYLQGLKNRITSDYWHNFVKKGESLGFDKKILANISSNNNPDDYESFTRERARMFNYISDLGGYDIRVLEPAKNNSKITAELAPQSDENKFNLLSNGGFEEESRGVPNGWQNRWKDGGGKSLNSRTKRSGKKSWQFKQKNNDGKEGALSDFIPVSENKTYKFSAWIKTKSETRILVRWFEFENDQDDNLTQPHTSYLGLGTNNLFAADQGGWQKISTAIKLRDKKSKFIKLEIANFKGTVFWDDLFLVDEGSEYLNSLPCENSDSAKCLDFDSNFSILPQETFSFDFPEFNTDKNGWPKTPMALEIKYKDTLDYSTKGKATFSERAIVYSKINYQAKDNFLYGYVSSGKTPQECQKPISENKPDYCFPSDKVDYPILPLGEINDQKWKYSQYFFPNTNLPMIRAVNGKFSFKIVMPKGDDFKTSSLPIDYISLRAASDSDYDLFDQKQRDLFGYWQVDFVDKPSKKVDYLNNDLVLFSRDIMRPIYKQTIPKPEEVGREVSSFSALGEIEPLSFGIYSGKGIDDLTVTVDDLSKGNEKIPKENISIKKVVYDKRRLMPEDYFSYALVPDRLEDLQELKVEANSSVRIWLEVKIPDKLSGGDYKGRIHLKKGGQGKASLGFKMTILPLNLERPESISYTWGDPAEATFANKTQDLFAFYRDYQLTTQIYIHPNDYQFINNGSVLKTDFTNLKKRIGYYYSQGIIKKKQPINIWVFAEALYKQAYPGWNFSDADLYTKLSSSEFSQPFSAAIKELIAIAKEKNFNFVFEITDEPNNSEERIYAQEINRLIKESGGETLANLTANSEAELQAKDISPFFVPPANLPLQPLSKSTLLDNKVWNLEVQGGAFENKFPNNYGYYTTQDSYLRTPINNRFLHGLLAFKTEAKMIYAYSVANWYNDPFRDFDLRPIWPWFSQIESDRILVYPTLSGELIPTMAAEGLREGIKDVKYIATLKKLSNNKKDKTTHPNGTLIKANDSAAIYLLGDGKKSLISSWSIFVSQFNLGAVVEVSASEVDAYSLGEPIKYQEGTLFKTLDNPAVYVVENGKRRHIPSPSIFESLGYNWEQIIIAEDNHILELHPKGENIFKTNLHPNGTLIKTVSSPAVYFLHEGKKRPIISPSIFNSRFVSWGRIVIISQAEMDSYHAGENLGYRNGTIFRVEGNPAVYAVESQKKRWIASPAVFNQLGYKWENIILAENQEVANLLPLGQTLE